MNGGGAGFVRPALLQTSGSAPRFDPSDLGMERGDGACKRTHHVAGHAARLEERRQHAFRG